MENLLPCPFCGSQGHIAKINSIPTVYQPMCSGYILGSVPHCGIEGPEFLSEETATAWWNSRSDNVLAEMQQTIHNQAIRIMDSIVVVQKQMHRIEELDKECDALALQFREALSELEEARGDAEHWHRMFLEGGEYADVEWD